MSTVRQVSKRLYDVRKEAEQNTRRLHRNFPLVERKLDVVSSAYSFQMEFPLTERDHHALLSIKIKPDNCCECDPGEQGEGHECVAYNEPNFGYPDGTPYPAKYLSPITQTQTYFNYGYGGPFFYPFYVPYPGPGGFTANTIDPKTNVRGGIVIPIDGIYEMLFRIQVSGVAEDDAASVISFIGCNGDSVSQKVFSIGRGNLQKGPFHLDIYQYASCIDFRQGDVVGGWLAASGVYGYQIGGGDGNTSCQTTLNLIGYGHGTLTGRVIDEYGNPLEGVNVYHNLGFGGSTLTDADGVYIFDSLRPATYQVTFSKTGYKTWTQDAVVTFESVTTLDTILWSA